MSTKVLITGASGYIGFEVARAFRRQGYLVYGLVRSETKAEVLRRNEIIPVLGDLSKPDTYVEYVKQANIIVDNVMDYAEAEKGRVNRQLYELVLETADQGWHQKKTFIFTSGLLVYGDHPGEVVDETTPIAPFPALQWRIDHEKRIVGEKRVHGVVIRPGFVYGYSGSWSTSFFNIPGPTLSIRGKREKKWSWVHADDLAQAYVLAARRIHAARGQVFNIGLLNAPTVEELHLAAAKAVGFTGQVSYEPAGEDAFSRISDVTVVLNPRKAVDVLGWQPNHLGILEELPVLYEAIKAHQPHASLN